MLGDLSGLGTDSQQVRTRTWVWLFFLVKLPPKWPASFLSAPEIPSVAQQARQLPSSAVGASGSASPSDSCIEPVTIEVVESLARYGAVRPLFPRDDARYSATGRQSKAPSLRAIDPAGG